MKKDATTITTLSLVGITILSGIILASSKVSADDSAVDTTTITVPVSCIMSSSIDAAHNATLSPGTYSGASGSQYENGIGKTTLTTYCNDNNGFSIYAIGFTGDSYDGENHTKLVGTSTSGNVTIPTKVYESTDTTSNWSMKVTKVENPTSGDPITYNPQNMNITNSFNSWHVIPDTYTKVAEYHATAGSSTTDTALGAKVETTYASYIAPTQAADTYTGKVKYTMVHPYIFIPDRLNVTYNANGLTFANGEATNYMTYDAVKIVNPGIVTKHARSVYNEDGAYNGYAAPGGNSVVTIPNASSIHIEVTIGVPQNNGGPASDLYIWSGNHPDYTYIDNTTSLTSCGTATATDGAFHSTGSPGSQVTIECDIVGDSVTFYDYSISTNGNVSTGYYATITNVGGFVSYTKNSISGTYSTPTGAPGTYVFYGWSENPNATSPAYESEADIISKAPYTNQDGDVTLYAIWIRPPEMQNLAASECTSTMSQAVDNRDNTIYNIQRLADGKCWLLDNLALDLTSSTVLNGMNESNTHASNTTLGYLKGTTTRDPSTDPDGKYATAGVSNWTSSSSYSAPLVNLTDKDVVPTDAISTAGQYKVGGYYNYCAASAGSYCYGNGTSEGAPSVTPPKTSARRVGDCHQVALPVIILCWRKPYMVVRVQLVIILIILITEMHSTCRYPVMSIIGALYLSVLRAVSPTIRLRQKTLHSICIHSTC